jgi:hypothetical protein
MIPDNEDCVLEQLNPNVPKVCTVLFEVAADASGWKLKVSNFAFLFPAEGFIELVR